jgi:1-acyl-sn-glycerol-3-phosphate acyltransferase
MNDDREPPSLVARFFAALRLAIFYLFSGLFIPIIVVIASFDSGGSAYYPLVRFWARAALAIFGIRVAAEGVEQLRPGQDYVLLANHRSHFDSLSIVHALDGRQTRWVAKRELTKVPLFGYGLKVTGQILVDRKDHAQAIEVLRANLGKHGVSVVFFGEGERSHGRKLAPFKKGGAAFAIDAGLPVVPVAVAGSERVLPKHSLVVLPGLIRVTFGEPISTEGMGPEDRERLTTLAHDRVASLLAAVEPTARGA